MNIFLVPYSWTRHLAVGVFCAGAGVLAWWLLLVITVLVGPTWAPSLDGALLLGGISAAVAGASVLAESLLRRRALPWLLLSTVGSALLSGGLAVLFYEAWVSFLAPQVAAPIFAFAIDSFGLFTGKGGVQLAPSQVKDLAEAVPLDAQDATLVSLRYRLGAFVLAGVATAIGPIVTRKAAGLLVHLGTGMVVGLLAGAAWYLLGSIFGTDLHVAGAGLGLFWGLLFGLFGWGIPDSLYAGWIRVLSPDRFGRRIPVDAPDGLPKERFIGHYPRGMDLFLPPSTGVSELHVSVAIDARKRYVARGLTLLPTWVRRFLERVDLRYDVRRPAPLETVLSSGDRIVLGDKPGHAELEFLMLPREEK
jgi:hypothetical protein